MTGPALVCWAAHLGWLNLEDSRLVFMESTLATYGFSALALGELVADKLPFIPNRTSPGPLFGRVVLGALSGSALCAATGFSLAAGAILGAAGGAAGAFAGFQARAFVEGFGFARLGDCPGGRSGRCRRRSFPGFANHGFVILIQSEFVGGNETPAF